MINPFKIRKIVALIIAAYIPCILFFVGVTFYNLWIGLILMGLSTIITTLLGSKLLMNPFSAMLEGRGILAINVDSTGIMTPFIVEVAQPYIRSIFKGKKIRDIWNRNTVMTMNQPVEVKAPATWNKDGSLHIDISAKDLNANRFGFYHYPCLIWNDMIKSFIPKTYFTKLENSAFAEHQVMYMNRQTEDLTSSVRDFGRYVIESLKPLGGILKSSWFWIIIIIGLIILAALFLPDMINGASAMVGGATDSVASSSGAITPR